MLKIGDSPARRDRVCIYGEKVAAALEGNVIGGAELQGALLARALARAGCEVTVIDPRTPADRLTTDGVQVLTVPRWNKGIRGIRMFTHRIPGLLHVLYDRKPGVVYMRGFSFISLVLLVFTLATRSLTVLAVASDMDLAGFRQRYRSFYRGNATLWGWITEIIPNHLTAGFTLRWAHVVLYQHPGQARLLPVQGVQFSNIVADDVFQVPPAAVKRNVLIVGLIAAHKGLRELLPVIRRLPSLTFEFVGAPSGREGQNIEEGLRQCSNVLLHGQLPRPETLRKIAGAEVLLNVSPAEGFPNTFLEAWALGTPVLSLSVDPAGIIAANRLGLVCGGDTELMAQALETKSYRQDPARLTAYVKTHHSMVTAAELFITTISRAAGHRTRAKKEPAPV